MTTGQLLVLGFFSPWLVIGGLYALRDLYRWVRWGESPMPKASRPRIDYDGSQRRGGPRPWDRA